jgi:hypothetical protein
LAKDKKTSDRASDDSNSPVFEKKSTSSEEEPSEAILKKVDVLVAPADKG